MWCKIIGHKWNFSKENIKHITNIGTKSVSINVDTEFRFCPRCFLKQQRFISFVSSMVWIDCQLGLEESREKKLKELGI
jgi:hypothetical protein